MILRVGCDRESFREVKFQPGFNVILATKTEDSSERDSRNGVGKTSLLYIIHFCLGSSFRKKNPLKKKELEGWEFELEMTVDGHNYLIQRSTGRQSRVKVTGDFSFWELPDGFSPISEEQELGLKEWRNLLGRMLYELPTYENLEFSPSFRTLVSYALRKPYSMEAPFKIHPSQRLWETQVHNAYLIGLEWEFASRIQALKDEERELNNIIGALRKGEKAGYFKTLGELESERVKLARFVEKTQKQIQEFKVHPEYERIVTKADGLTDRIQNLANESFNKKRYIGGYRKAIEEEKQVDSQHVIALYEQAEVHFSSNVIKRIGEVQDFHRDVIKNRREFLRNEIEWLENEIEKIQNDIAEKSSERAELMQILSTHGALQEFSLIQSRYTEQKKKLDEIIQRIKRYERMEDRKSRIKIEREKLAQSARISLKEKKEHLDFIRGYFNQISSNLYDSPGRLAIDVDENGYNFRIIIERSESLGYAHMKTYSYDMAITMSREHGNPGPDFLFHDSSLFDGVDSRQASTALETAWRISETQKNFQYVCALNSDAVPREELSTAFSKEFDKSTIITLADHHPTDSLFGIRF